MFARSVSFHLKPGGAAQFTQLFDQDIIPVLRKQKGFQDEIAFVAPDGAEAVGISMWDLKDDADTYAARRVCRCIEGAGAGDRGHASGADVRGVQFDLSQACGSRECLTPTRRLVPGLGGHGRRFGPCASSCANRTKKERRV